MVDKESNLISKRIQSQRYVTSGSSHESTENAQKSQIGVTQRHSCRGSQVSCVGHPTIDHSLCINKTLEREKKIGRLESKMGKN